MRGTRGPAEPLRGLWERGGAGEDPHVLMDPSGEDTGGQVREAESAQREGRSPDGGGGMTAGPHAGLKTCPGKQACGREDCTLID